MRFKAKIDANQPAIVGALRQIGCSVQSLAALGNGVPDLLIARNGFLFLLEVKDGNRCPSDQLLTEDQEDWIAKWKSEVHIARSVDEALRIASEIVLI